MLPRQVIERFYPHKRMGGRLFNHLQLTHLVQTLDRHTPVFGAVFHKNNPAASLETTANILQHLIRMRKLVVDIHHNRHVYGFRRQFRVGDGAQDPFDVRDTRLRHFLIKQIEHLLLNVNAVNSTCLADFRSDPPSDVTRPNADIRHDISCFEFQQFDEDVWHLFAFTFRTLQPVRALVSHHVRDFASHIEFANTVSAWRSLFITRAGWTLRILRIYGVTQ